MFSHINIIDEEMDERLLASWVGKVAVKLEPITDLQVIRHLQVCYKKKLDIKCLCLSAADYQSGRRSKMQSALQKKQTILVSNT